VPAPLANWNRARDVWETSHSHIDLFSELSAVYSATWPTSGMTRDGVAYELPMPAPLMDDSGFSSSPGRNLATPTASIATGGPPQDSHGKRDLRLDMVQLLKTPTSQLAVNGGSQHPDKRKAGGHGPTLADEVEHLLPTPTATPYGNNQSPSPGAAVRPSLDTLAPMLLPTPASSDGDRTSMTYGRGNPTLSGALLPTPTVQDAGGSRNCTQPRKPGMAPATGTTLTDWLWLHEGWTGASTAPLFSDGNGPSDE